MIQMISRLRVRPGRHEAFLAWCTRLVRIANRESGTLKYECYFDAGFGRCLFIETYRDSRCLDVHLGAVAEEIVAGHDNYDIEHLDVCGDLSSEQRAMFASLGDPEDHPAKVIFYQLKAERSPLD